MSEELEIHAQSATQRVAELEHNLSVLRRKIEREKRAREQSEKLLEYYTRETYKANQALQSSLKKSRKRQSQLQFLSLESSEVASEQSISGLLHNTVALTGRFFKADSGTVMFFGKEKIQELNRQQVWYFEQGWQSAPEIQTFIHSQLPSDNDEVLDRWLVSPIEESTALVPDVKWIVYLKLSLTDDDYAWIAFLSSAEMLDEESLYVLDTAKGHLLSGIRRRLNDISLGEQNVQLQQTVETLEVARSQLMQSEKMASLGQMAAGVAHEINNPIGFIRSNLEVLRDYLSNLDSAHKQIVTLFEQKALINEQQYMAVVEALDLDFIHEDSNELIATNLEGVDRVRDIVDSLRTFSHSADTEFTPVQLKNCIDAALQVSWNSLKYDYKVDNTVESSLPEIKGNVGQLQQVFVNLFVNAAQAMSKGGVLSIQSRVSAQSLTIDVKDTGHGMDEKTLNQLFTPFFTTKPVGEGTGLGLSLSYAIVEAHDGKIEVTSEIGKGTCFSLIFPILRS